MQHDWAVCSRTLKILKNFSKTRGFWVYLAPKYENAGLANTGGSWGCTADAANVLRWVPWEIVQYHMTHMGDVDAPANMPLVFQIAESTSVTHMCLETPCT